MAQFPSYATAWALLSLTYLDELRFRYRGDDPTEAPLDRALEAAQRAVQLDPDNTRALQAQMTSLMFKGDSEAALKIGARAVAINPNDTELLAEYGQRLSHSGEWKRGGELLAQALDRSPGSLGYHEANLALCFFMQGDFPAAGAWIRKSNVQANPLFHFVAAAIYGELGDVAAADRERAWILKNAPDILRDVHHELAIRFKRPADREHFLAGLSKAGLTIPAS